MSLFRVGSILILVAAHYWGLLAVQVLAAELHKVCSTAVETGVQRRVFMQTAQQCISACCWVQESAAKLRKEDREVGRGRKWRTNYRLLNQEVLVMEEEEKQLDLVYPQVLSVHWMLSSPWMGHRLGCGARCALSLKRMHNLVHFTVSGWQVASACLPVQQ